MDSNAQLQLLLGFVTYREHSDVTQQVQAHGGYFSGMLVAVPLGEPRRHHVSVTHSLDLWKHENVQLQFPHTVNSYNLISPLNHALSVYCIIIISLERSVSLLSSNFSNVLV